MKAQEAPSAPGDSAHCPALDFPFTRENPLRPPPALAEFQTEGAIPRIRMWDGTEAWLVTRYDDVKAVLAHPNTSSDNSLHGFPAIVPHRKYSPEAAAAPDYQPLLTDLVGGDHARLRRIIAAEFSVKRVHRLEELLGDIVDSTLDDLEEHGAPADLVPIVLKEIPSQIIGTILGFPEEERAQWRTWFETWVAPSTSQELRLRTRQEMLDYIEGRLAASTGATGDDFVSRLVAARDSGEIVSKELRMLVFLLYAAGFDTTANSMAFSIVELLTNRAQAARLREPEADVAAAVEELLRLTTIVHFGLSRVADGGPIELRGQRIEDGDGVVVSILAANYDPDVFPEPWAVDVTRDARAQVGFGFGPHQCVGQQLARAELAALLPRLFRRFPDLELAVRPEELTYLPNGTRVMRELPVRW
jgi:cytochrome P450